MYLKLKIYLLWMYVQQTVSTDYTAAFSWDWSYKVFWTFLLFLPSTFSLGPDGKLIGLIPQIYDPQIISSHKISLLFCTNVSLKSRHCNFHELSPFNLTKSLPCYLSSHILAKNSVYSSRNSKAYFLVRIQMKYISYLFNREVSLFTVRSFG